MCETESQVLDLGTLSKGPIEGGSKGTSFERDSSRPEGAVVEVQGSSPRGCVCVD